MKQTLNQGVPTPTANLAINKSRMKVYGKNSEVPTYYLNKGQEFQIELFNPTTNNILAKISLNSKPIAQGGLVIRPGERVFLDRYIDVARKFKFDTYEVANTNEVKEAIKENGDFKVEFHKEYIVPVEYTPPVKWEPSWNINDYNVYCDGIGNNNLTMPTTFDGPNARNFGVTNNLYAYTQPVTGNINLTGGGTNGTLTTTNLGDGIGVATASAGVGAEPTLDFMDVNLSRDFAPQEVERPIKKLKSRRRLVKKSVETGRVEMGSTSSQEMTTVNMNWDVIAFHTVEYKMLPLSQKVNTVQSITTARYCTSCGVKQKANFKFCPSCGTRA